MKMSNVLKRLLVVLPILAIAACASKNTSSDQSGGEIGTTTTSQQTLSSAEQAKLAFQQLQKNNIVYFAFDRYDITPEYAEILDEHAAYLRQHPNTKIVIQGNADERGTPEYNIALGERRANAVKMYLQGKGVPASQLSTVSYGSEKPAVLGHTEAAYAKNRRAVLAY